MIGASWRKVFAIGGLIEASSQVIVIEFLRLYSTRTLTQKKPEKPVFLCFLQDASFDIPRMPDTLPTHDLPSNRTGWILQLHPRASRRIGAAAIASHGIFWKTTKRVSGSLKPLVKNAVCKKRCFIVICLAYLFFSKAQDLCSFHNRWVSTGENGFFV